MHSDTLAPRREMASQLRVPLRYAAAMGPVVGPSRPIATPFFGCCGTRGNSAELGVRFATARTIMSFPPGDRGGELFRIDYCQSCGAYLKTIMDRGAKQFFGDGLRFTSTLSPVSGLKTSGLRPLY